MALLELNRRFLETRQRKRSSHPWSNLRCYIDVSALVAVMIVLIIINMPLVVTCGGRIAINMPAVSHPILMPGADRYDALLVGITRDSRIYLGTQNIAYLEQLPAAIRDGLNHGAEHKVYIRADARAKYRTVMDAVDGIRDAGVQDVGFLVEDRRPALSTP